MEAQHTDDCAVLPLETWDQKTPCSCGAWDARLKESLSRKHFIIEESPFMEELLWLPAGVELT